MMARAAKNPDRLTPADVVVLAMLGVRPTHGYDLVAEQARREAGGGGGGGGGTGAEGPAVSRAQIYYSLKKLLKQGLIVVAKDAAPATGPEREPYRLTAAGRRAISRAVAQPQWARQRPPIPFQMWLVALGQAEPQDRALALRSRAEHLDRQIEDASRAVDAAGGDAPSARIALAVAEHALEVLRLERQLLCDVEPMLGG